MTHSLHRIGSIDALNEDYVVLACLAKDVNREKPESRQKLIKIGEIMKKNSPINMIPEFTWKISPVLTAVYTNVESIRKTILELKKEDLGISIVISGLISEVKRVLNEVGLKMHTVHLSLGVFGKKELLPPQEKVLEITTMCGHHCVSSQSAEYYADLIKKGKISIEKAAEKLSQPCVCGIFNTKRAITILHELTD